MSRFAGRTRWIVTSLALVTLPSISRAILPHMALRHSEPADGSRLTVAPTRISLAFSAKPQLAFSRIRLTGPGGAVPLDTIVGRGDSLSTRVRRPLDPGDYRIEWQTAAADGHPVRGQITFAVLASNAPVPAATPADTGAHAGHAMPVEAGRDESSFRTARWFEFVAVLTALGALGFRHGVLPPLASRGVPTSDAADRARRLGLSVLALYVVAVAVRLWTQSRALNGADAPMQLDALRAFVTGTTWGIGWAAGVVGAVLMLVGWALSPRSVSVGTPLALTGAIGMILSPALSGHAATGPQFVLSVTVDMLHVTVAGLWVGGLAMVLFAGIPAMLRLTDGNKHAAVSALVSSFHPLALFCAPIAVLSGFVGAWLRMGGFGSQWTTQYGQTLLVKIGLVLLLATMGAYNSMRVRRQLSGAGGEGTRRFRLTGTLELAFAAAVVIVTTFLVVTPLPGAMP
ncbi:MAG: copper resistance protein CopC [Gemmatimonadaceae bacterium]